jgi:FkbM family methyltransferase
MLNPIIRVLLALQGKGYGSTSIRREVSATRRFVSGGVMFDVGANKGVYCRELLRQYGNLVTEIHAFEPSREVFSQYLRHCDPRIRVNNVALSDVSGVATLYKAAHSSGLNSLTKRRLAHFDVEMNEVEEVRTTTLDEYVSANCITCVDLLKIDVEGHELDVLKGGIRCLSDDRIGCIQFEFGGCNIDTKSFVQDFWYLLVKNFQFRLYRITPLGVAEIKAYSELDETFLTTNFVATRNKTKRL